MKKLVWLQTLFFLLFTASSVRAERVDVGAGTIDLPQGWVVLEERDHYCMGTGIETVFRNAEGTVWILTFVHSPHVFKGLAESVSQWKVFEKGTLSGYDYIILLRPENESSPIIIFPQLKTYFSVILTENGFTDPVQALRGYSPPKGEQFQKVFDGVKRELFSSYIPAEPLIRHQD